MITIKTATYIVTRTGTWIKIFDNYVRFYKLALLLNNNT